MVFINEMLLLKGAPFKIVENLSVKNPTIDEILDFGEENYYKALGLFCSTPFDYLVELADKGIDWTEKTNYDIFLLTYSKELFQKEINWLFDGDYLFELGVNESNGERVVFDSKNDVVIDRLVYEQISSFLKRINFRSEIPEFTPANQFAKEMIIEQKRKELKRALKRPPKIESHLATLISFLLWNNTNGMSIEDIFKLNIYQLHDGIKRLQKTEHYRNIMLGYYTGNISGKDIKFDSIDWMGKTTIE